MYLQIKVLGLSRSSLSDFPRDSQDLDHNLFICMTWHFVEHVNFQQLCGVPTHI
jgi:hypothetical protein